MVSQNSCIFPCRIWEIEDIQIAETVKSSLPSQTTFMAYATLRYQQTLNISYVFKLDTARLVLTIFA